MIKYMSLLSQILSGISSYNESILCVSALFRAGYDGKFRLRDLFDLSYKRLSSAP